jgi:hypothetical protein
MTRQATPGRTGGRPVGSFGPGYPPRSNNEATARRSLPRTGIGGPHNLFLTPSIPLGG